MKNLYVKGFFIFFILSICLSFFRVYQLGHNAEPYNLFHILPALMFNEIFDGIFPFYPDVINFIPIALTDGVLGALTVLLIKLFPANIRNKKEYFYLVLLISFICTQWIIFNYVPIFQS
ncbi:hypothetical protein CIB95_13420 [Lottiidibacillus patelloidae]|uniref:Uncharacterized protein n=1 Tax=Lottiidibacillus patelloidae TaxID=2670334 RepID=A0A263BQY2_9BACI|nr:hypothetical protein [Lottiidibacillus patelloidae]OZM56103.1 hypothetical protein CIB95_13420 [Lottiidibacillus patelloidae]